MIVEPHHQEEFSAFCHGAPTSLRPDIMLRFFWLGMRTDGGVIRTWEDISRSTIVLFPHDN